MSSTGPRLRVFKGWVRSSRTMKNHLFIDLLEGDSVRPRQIVVPKGLLSETSRYCVGSSLEVTGILQRNVKNDTEEVLASTVKMIGDVADGYPLPKESSNEYFRKVAHFRQRTVHSLATHKIRNSAFLFTHQYFMGKGFLHINTPILTTNLCEGGSEVFSVCSSNGHQLFTQKTYLTPSSQLHLEAAASGFKRVYTMNPTFRAETSNTSRHLSEFTMLEVEVAFENQLSYFMDLVEDYLKATYKHIQNSNPDELNYLLTDYNRNHVRSNYNCILEPFERITYSDAVRILKDSGKGKTVNEFVEWGQGLSTDHELFIADYFKRPVFISHYPAADKPFYMKEELVSVSGIERTVVSNFDLIFPMVGELVGGSLREDRYDRLAKKLPSSNHGHSLSWYLDLRKYGGVPHGGFGIGFDRFIQFITGFANIRDVAYMARTPGHIQY